MDSPFNRNKITKENLTIPLQTSLLSGQQMALHVAVIDIFVYTAPVGDGLPFFCGCVLFCLNLTLSMVSQADSNDNLFHKKRKKDFSNPWWFRGIVGV